MKVELEFGYSPSATDAADDAVDSGLGTHETNQKLIMDHMDQLKAEVEKLIGDTVRDLADTLSDLLNETFDDAFKDLAWRMLIHRRHCTVR
jgi:hypothetical protein